MTMMLSPRRNGSGKKAAGRRKTSELVPSAWPVDDPSKFHSLSSSTDLIGPSRVYIRKGNKGDLCQFAVSLFFAGDGNRVGKQVEARKRVWDEHMHAAHRSRAFHPALVVTE